ncbi:MAG: YggS family pyridoxal phosphate-dependent enzyme [Proteiniphilum sp.]|nr:YggS family pyridoxal phosphate-dependent enzyme [Proteiniphilum sp.]NCD15009.1 YggS family pyridoxal phosphate-dependent enzyme [Bacteroidia bacterium]HHT34459.1 YggS family pyridoxal phosphate-dependent enzyme [Bacteroidales bacterium]MDD2727458.1 YggS family pyridoxal phosphate-dependent enzyme [Proteiniphilum sp.]MDD3333064.1 YggS family pyridoxal phosphate-dependent enzyme [Proteiniphilum sp.]
MNIATHIQKLRESLPSRVRVVAVSKFHPVDQIREAYDAGQRLFGESRVQELVTKQQELPADIEWHFIGNLQRNKVKQIAPFVTLIHSLDSERLMREIEKQGAVNERVIRCLLQIHIAEEETKSGFTPEECRRFLKEGSWRDCSHLQIAGMMGMATYTEDREQVRREFRQLRNLFEESKVKYFADDPAFRELSMGMSGDYSIALEEGSTLIRLGTLIFGER